MKAGNWTTSVVLPTFNRARYIRTSLESILTQTIPPDQVIVVNDGSTDYTTDAVAPFRHQITYLEQRNAGKPAAINAALSLVEGDYLWVFDDDDVACPDALERHIETLEARPEAGFSYGGSYYAEDHPQSDWLCVRGELRPRDFPEEDFLAELFLESYTPSPAVVVRTATQGAAGRYNEELTRSQDWEMAIRWSLHAPGVRLPATRPTYYRRFHRGERGKSGQQFSDAERVTRGRAFSRHILRGLSDRVELRHYLPYPQWNKPLDKVRRRVALSRRLAVHLRKGMWPEALVDLDELADIGFDKEGPGSEEAHFLLRGLAHGDAVRELREEGLEAAFRRRLTPPALRPLRRVLVRGLYYQFRAALDRRDWAEARRTALVMGRVLGARGVVSELAGRG